MDVVACRKNVHDLDICLIYARVYSSIVDFCEGDDVTAEYKNWSAC